MKKRKHTTPMRFLGLALGVSMLFCACGTASNLDPTTGTPETTATTPPPTDPPVVLIPSQEGLDAGVEYRFEGEYDTGVIGTAPVVGLFYYDGTYEVTASLWGYSTAITWGEWTFQDGKFLLTDSYNNLNLEATGDGTTYTFTCTFSETDINMTATMTGTKPIDQLHVDPNPQQATEPIESDASEDYLLYQVDAADGFYARFYKSGYFAIYQSIAQFDMATGTWEYTPDTGLSIVIDGTPAEIAAADGNFTFVGTAMGFPREYVVSEAELSASIERDTPLELPPVINDVYSSWTDEQWAALWADDSFAPEENPNYTYPATKLDNTFESSLPKDYFTPVEEAQRGTVKSLTYKTHIYAYYAENNIPEDQWVPVEKQCYVYLPAGYDESKQYNVYYLMHGATGSEKDWFSMACDGSRDNGAGDFVVLADYLIANGIIEPTIFVSATTNTDVSHMGVNIRNSFSAGHETQNFPFELKNDLIPAVEGTYSSYAADTTQEALIASREHRAFAGLSLGAFVVWNTIAETNDVIAYYAPLSNGCATGDDQTAAAQLIFDGLNDAYGVSFLFSSCGLKDHCLQPQEHTFNTLYELGKDTALTYGENCYNFNPENGTHTAKYFILGVYNSMKVFF